MKKIVRSKRPGRKAWILAAAFAAIGLARRASAMGLRTQFGEVVVRNLQIGQTYSLYKLMNLPLRILNTGSKSADLEIKLVRISSANIRPGYEPLPDLSWVKLDKNEFEVEPNHEAVTDIVISIPNDKKLLGKRFEADIWSRNKDITKMYSVAIMSRLLLQVSSIPPTDEELKKKFVNSKLTNLDFTLFPTEGLAKNVPIGKPFDLKKERGISLKLVNPNDQELHFRIRSLGAWESLLTAPNNYDPNIIPQWLTPESDLVDIPGNNIKDVGLILNLPNDPKYYGRNLFFVVSVDVMEQEIPTHVYYKLLVQTEKNPNAAQTQGAAK